ncbi:hypothetical protein SRHO_G00080230 [Serrasalmus rhombeus]
MKIWIKISARSGSPFITEPLVGRDTKRGPDPTESPLTFLEPRGQILQQLGHRHSLTTGPWAGEWLGPSRLNGGKAVGKDDLWIMCLHAHHDRVTTSTVTTAAYEL